jgi:photosystem II stability/assembly factor-like uncharacterized protein
MNPPLNPPACPRRPAFYLAAALAAALGIGAGPPARAQETTVAALARETHFHGIAADAKDPARLYLATHHGFYAVSPDGKAVLLSRTRDDFMGFTPHPRDAAVLYASGHPQGGGNLGFMASRDGGRTWTRLSDGVGGPVDFHQMDVSKADPNVIYGAYGELQRSGDGGRTWRVVGPAPEGLIALAASGKSADWLYAATQQGLLVSRDGGRGWAPAHPARQPATMVHAGADGQLYAFVLGAGLVRASEGEGAPDWQTVSAGFGRNLVLHLATTQAGAFYAVTYNQDFRTLALQVSRDGGRSWAALGGR